MASEPTAPTTSASAARRTRESELELELELETVSISAPCDVEPAVADPAAPASLVVALFCDGFVCRHFTRRHGWREGFAQSYDATSTYFLDALERGALPAGLLELVECASSSGELAAELWDYRGMPSALCPLTSADLPPRLRSMQTSQGRVDVRRLRLPREQPRVWIAASLTQQDETEQGCMDVDLLVPSLAALPSPSDDGAIDSMSIDELDFGPDTSDNEDAMATTSIANPAAATPSPWSSDDDGNGTSLSALSSSDASSSPCIQFLDLMVHEATPQGDMDQQHDPDLLDLDPDRILSAAAHWLPASPESEFAIDETILLPDLDLDKSSAISDVDPLAASASPVEAMSDLEEELETTPAAAAAPASSPRCGRASHTLAPSSPRLALQQRPQRPLSATHLFLSKLKGKRTREHSMDDLHDGSPVWMMMRHMGEFFHAALTFERQHSEFLRVNIDRILRQDHEFHAMASGQLAAGSMEFLALQLHDTMTPHDVVEAARLSRQMEAACVTPRSAAARRKRECLELGSSEAMLTAEANDNAADLIRALLEVPLSPSSASASPNASPHFATTTATSSSSRSPLSVNEGDCFEF